MCAKTRKTINCADQRCRLLQKESRRYDKLQILHVRISLRHRRVVVEHQQNAR